MTIQYKNSLSGGLGVSPSFGNVTDGYNFNNSLSAGLGATLGGVADAFGLGGLGSLFGGIADTFFGGTDAQYFLNAGTNWVNDAVDSFKIDSATNILQALTDLSYKLNKGVAKFEVQLQNASQPKTIEGNRKSKKDVQNALLQIPSILKAVKENYDVSISQSRDVFSAFGLSERFNWNVYTGQLKTETIEDNSSNVATNGNNIDEPTPTKAPWYKKISVAFVAIPLAVIGVGFAIYKLIKK